MSVQWAVVGRQHGTISVAQLRASGLSHDAVAQRVRQGWLRRKHRGVYVVGPLETPLTAPMAAVLAIGRAAALSHYPAAVLWRLLPPREGPMEVIVGRDVRDRDGIRVHRATLHPADVTRRHGIPVTSPERTLLDLAATERDVERALNEARILRLVSDLSLDEQFSRYPRHRGAAALKDAAHAAPGFTRSEAERRALQLIRRAQLPEPETNVRLHGYEVDFLWRDQRLIAEIDGYAFHSMRSSFERDRRRDQRLMTAGYTVIRITWRQLTEKPEAVVATLASALTARA